MNAVQESVEVEATVYPSAVYVSAGEPVLFVLPRKEWTDVPEGRNGVAVHWVVTQGTNLEWVVRAKVVSTWHYQLRGEIKESLEVIESGDTMDAALALANPKVRRNVQYWAYICSNMKNEVKFPHIEVPPEKQRKPCFCSDARQSSVLNSLTSDTMQTRPYGMRG